MVPRLVRLVWETHRPYTAGMVVLRIVRSAVPVATLWVAKLIIDEVIMLASRGGPSRHLWVLVATELGIVVGGELLARASGLVEGLLGDLFTNRISIRIMEHAATLDLHQFEDPNFYDHLERARQGTTGRIALLAQLLGMGQSVLTLASLSAALAAQAPWLLVLLVVAVLPSFIGETHFAAQSYSLLFRWTPQRRQLDYVRAAGNLDISLYTGKDLANTTMSGAVSGSISGPQETVGTKLQQGPLVVNVNGPIQPQASEPFHVQVTSAALSQGAKLTDPQIEHAAKQRDEHHLFIVHVELAVDLRQDFGWRRRLAGDAFHQRLGDRHEEGGRHPFPRHIS